MGIGFRSRFSPDSPVSRTPVTTATPCFSRDRTSLGSRLSTPASGLGRTRRRPGPRLAWRLRCRRWTAACRRAGCKTRTPRCRPRPASPAWHSSPAGPAAACSLSGTCCFSCAGAGGQVRNPRRPAHQRGIWGGLLDPGSQLAAHTARHPDTNTQTETHATIHTNAPSWAPR